MFRSLALMLPLFALAQVAADDDKKADREKPALTGIWTRESNGHDLTLDFTGKDTFKLSAFADANGAIVTSKYAVKDGVVKAKIIKVEVKGDFKSAPKEGVEFSFKWKVKGDTGTLDDFEGAGLDAAKPVLEGDYAKKKGKD